MAKMAKGGGLGHLKKWPFCRGFWVRWPRWPRERAWLLTGPEVEEFGTGVTATGWSTDYKDYTDLRAGADGDGGTADGVPIAKYYYRISGDADDFSACAAAAAQLERVFTCPKCADCGARLVARGNLLLD